MTFNNIKQGRLCMTKINPIEDFLKNVPICKKGTNEIVDTIDLSMLQEAKPKNEFVFGCFLDIEGNVGFPKQRYIYQDEVYEIIELGLNEQGAYVNCYLVRKKEYFHTPLGYIYGKCKLTSNP